MLSVVATDGGSDEDVKSQIKEAKDTFTQLGSLVA